MPVNATDVTEPTEGVAAALALTFVVAQPDKNALVDNAPRGSMGVLARNLRTWRREVGCMMIPVMSESRHHMAGM
jgi:hypothetical protein